LLKQEARSKKQEASRGHGTGSFHQISWFKLKHTEICKLSDH